VVGSTSFAIAKAALNEGLVSSKVQTEGSAVTLLVQVAVTLEEVSQFDGASNVRAETKGATKARRVNLQNILKVVWY